MKWLSEEREFDLMVIIAIITIFMFAYAIVYC